MKAARKPKRPNVISRKTLRRIEGWVYIFKAPSGHYKIGHTANLDRRQNELSAQLPFPLERIHAIKTRDRFALEYELHQAYADKRVNGEWFALTDQDIVDLKAFKEKERRTAVFIGFKAFEDSDDDLISWWKNQPHGERSLLFRKILRDWLGHKEPITTEHIKGIRERLDSIDAHLGSLTEDEIAFRESRIRNQRW